MKIKSLAAIAALGVITGCSDSIVSPKETPVGSTYSKEIDWLSFSVDTTYIFTGYFGRNYDTFMVAEGRVANLGTETINPNWLVEAQFYSDSTFNTKLGGNADTILVSLEPRKSVVWKVYFSSTSVNTDAYPNFRVSNLRGIAPEVTK